MCILGANVNNGKEMIDLNHNQQYSNNCVKVENIYPKGVIPSVVTSDDEMDDAAVDSGTESCDSKDSVSNKKGERKRPGRKKGQGNYRNILRLFLRHGFGANLSNCKPFEFCLAVFLPTKSLQILQEL